MNDSPSARMRAIAETWNVVADASSLRTASSELLAGTRDGIPVMLKLALAEEEVRGSALLEWWDARGAAPVLAREGAATLMLRAVGTRELRAMSEAGDDARATSVLVDTVRELHDRRPPHPDEGVPLVPLQTWFRDLTESRSEDAVIRRASGVAKRLLALPPGDDEVALHGDIHHGNVLHFGDRWAAIDPKGLLGHRAFDYANLLCNPSEALAVAHLAERLRLICERAELDPDALTEWTIAWCGLSLIWAGTESDPSWHGRAARRVAEQLIAE